MAAEEPRLFTVAEARALVPRLRALLTTLQAEQQQLDATMRALEGLTPAMRGNGSAQEASRLELQLGELADAIQRRLEEIVRLGVEVKDIGLGLVDFPSLREGRVVYLCWRVDEPTVAFWHELDAGYLGRQPLEE